MSRPKATKNRVSHIWSEKEKECLKEIVTGNGYKKITELMNEKFEYQFSESQIKGAINRYGLITGLTGRFPKGTIPWNKGKRGINYEGMKATQFKKGNIPQNHKEVGSERITKKGYTMIKVAEPNVYKLKHRVIYEEYHKCKLGKNDVIIFADMNKNNFNIENLVKINRQQLKVLNQNGLIKNNAKFTKTGVNIANLIIKIQELNKNHRG